MNCNVFLTTLCCLLFLGSVQAKQTFAKGTFSLDYSRAKLLMRQKYYATALKKFESISKQYQEAKQHFGTNYYLALLYYRLAKIDQFLFLLNKLQLLSTTKKQRAYTKRLAEQFYELFSKVTVQWSQGTNLTQSYNMKLSLLNVFSHPQKIRAYRLLKARLAKGGLRPGTKHFYLPKGEYSLRFDSPSCLRLGVRVENQNKKGEFEVGAHMLAIKILPEKSCCASDEIAMKKNGQQRCLCKKGQYDPTQGKCVEKDKRKTWIAKHWPWMTVLGIGIVATGVTVPIVLKKRSQQKVKFVIPEAKLFE